MFLKTSAPSSFLSFRKEIGLGIRGPEEDECHGAETDTAQLGGRMQGLRGKNRLREPDQRTGTQVRRGAPQNRTLTLHAGAPEVVIRDKNDVSVVSRNCTALAWSHTFCFDIPPQDWLLEFISKTVNISGILLLQCTKP